MHGIKDPKIEHLYQNNGSYCNINLSIDLTPFNLRQLIPHFSLCFNDSLTLPWCLTPHCLFVLPNSQSKLATEMCGKILLMRYLPTTRQWCSTALSFLVATKIDEQLSFPLRKFFHSNSFSECLLAIQLS